MRALVFIGLCIGLYAQEIVLLYEAKEGMLLRTLWQVRLEGLVLGVEYRLWCSVYCGGEVVYRGVVEGIKAFSSEVIVEGYRVKEVVNILGDYFRKGDYKVVYELYDVYGEGEELITWREEQFFWSGRIMLLYPWLGDTIDGHYVEFLWDGDYERYRFYLYDGDRGYRLYEEEVKGSVFQLMGILESGRCYEWEVVGYGEGCGSGRSDRWRFCVNKEEHARKVDWYLLLDNGFKDGRLIEWHGEQLRFRLLHEPLRDVYVDGYRCSYIDEGGGFYRVLLRSRGFSLVEVHSDGRCYYFYINKKE